MFAQYQDIKKIKQAYAKIKHIMYSPTIMIKLQISIIEIVIDNMKTIAMKEKKITQLTISEVHVRLKMDNLKKCETWSNIHAKKVPT